MGALQLLRPNYYGEVMGDSFIHMGLGVIGTWMLIGIVMMQRMISMKI
jgi:Flp pilus assembly protein TadB